MAKTDPGTFDCPVPEFQGLSLIFRCLEVDPMPDWFLNAREKKSLAERSATTMK